MANAPHRWFPSALTYGLGRKIVLTFGAVLVSFVCATFAINIGTQGHIIAARLDERTAEMSKLLAEISSSYLFEMRVSELEIILEDVQRQPDIEYVKLIDPNGFVLATGQLDDHTFLSRDDDPSIEAAQRTGELVISESGSVRHITVPVELAGTVLGTIRIGISLAQYQSDIGLLRYRNAVIGGVFVIAGIVVSIFMSRRLTRPLRRLIDLARSARDGNLDQSLELSTNDEIETLAAEFGEMLRALRGTMGEINRLAYTDSLTGLNNRAWLNEFLGFVTHADKNERAAIIFLDLDRFKDINDTHGHDVGDHVLCEMSQRLVRVIKRHSIARNDMPVFGAETNGRETCRIGIARLGGDEFTIILRHILGLEEIEKLAQSIVATMRQPFDFGRTTFKTSASVGIALIPEHGATAQDILKNADVAMYQAKKAGRDTFRVYDPDSAAVLSERRIMEQSLLVGIAEQQLVLHFQPQFDIASQKPVAAEALVRWQHPMLGLIPPCDFLPLAEDTGLMGNIGRFVVSESLRLAAQWPCADDAPLRLAINISVRELSNCDFVDFVLAEIDRTDFPPERLELEVTESTAMEEDAEITFNIDRLRKYGIRFAVDDFGVGYSNLSRLKALQFETLKIDRSLMDGVGSDDGSEAIVGSLLQLAQALNLDVVAEGVERHEQITFLLGAGCQFAQGFGLSRPLPDAAFLDLLSQSDHSGLFSASAQSAA